MILGSHTQSEKPSDKTILSNTSTFLQGIFRKKNTAGGGVISDALKGRKGEKEMGILELCFGSKVQRRENVGGSLKTLDPTNAWRPVIGFNPFDESKYNTQKSICQVYCQKNFLGDVFFTTI